MWIFASCIRPNRTINNPLRCAKVDKVQKVCPLFKIPFLWGYDIYLPLYVFKGSYNIMPIKLLRGNLMIDY